MKSKPTFIRVLRKLLPFLMVIAICSIEILLVKILFIGALVIHLTSEEL